MQQLGIVANACSSPGVEELAALPLDSEELEAGKRDHESEHSLVAKFHAAMSDVRSVMMSHYGAMSAISCSHSCRCRLDISEECRSCTGSD